MLPACSATLDRDPPAALPYVATGISTAHTHTLIATEPAAAGADGIAWHGDPIASPTDDNGDPVALGLPAVTSVAVGKRHACAISTTGSVHCWGDQTGGALGAARACTPPAAEGGAPNCILGAAIISTIPPSRAIAAGNDITCAITREDRVLCWGDARLTGGSTVPALDPPTPVKVDGQPLSAARIVISEGNVCAIDKSAALWCWGDRFGGVPLRQPQQGVLDIALGHRHSCIVDASGLSCSGDDRNAQLDGDVDAARACGDGPCASVGAKHVEIAQPVRVVVGELHTCALSATGDVSCWGSNEVGQLGRNDAFLVGGIETILNGIVDIQAGYSHTCALGDDRSVWCWGSTLETDPSEAP